MTKKKVSQLKQALEGKSKPSAPAAAPAAAPINGNAPNRVYRGAVVSGYFDKTVQQELRMMSIRESTTVQKLLAEAINLLFEKRKLPQIADTTPSQVA
jgi:hypothetical protein